MRLGIDLDNTIISYDQLFSRLATELKLVPQHIAPNKQAIRDYLRRTGQEPRWTELQGIAYGSRIEEAVPFPGWETFLERCNQAEVDWQIISHRTQRPYIGDPMDLHEAARRWLLRRGFIPSLDSNRVRLETSREAKLQSIADSGCEIFIDDLPELLCDPTFPSHVRRILFDPTHQNPDRAEYERALSWAEIASTLHL